MNRKTVIKEGEYGQAMVLTAVFITFMVAFLLSFSIDMTRMMMVRNDLHEAVDSGCQAAAQAINMPLYKNTGRLQVDLGTGSGWALREFNASVVESGIVQYTPRITGMTLQSPTIVACTASADVNRLVPATPSITVRVFTTSETR
ncbi:MAG: Tad domain-containing protein [Anaerolineaceae bacterium]|nr:Tad domain-containing protein [Anaerolineaceae bacterium]